MLPLSKPTARQPRKWSVAEDQKLREEVESQRSEGEVKDWCRVAAKLPGRTNKDCRKRWLNSVAGGLKKGQWAKNEDRQLARGVEQFGQRWTLVADVVGSRSADQCAKRWQQSLDPELDRSEWRESEDQILIEAVQRLGRHWKDIQSHHFPGRSKNCIKNRYTVIIRRHQNLGVPVPEDAIDSAPSTPSNRLSIYSVPDDDNLVYPDSMYGCESFGNRTQVSTPETHHSWPLNEHPFTNWSSSQESFHMPPASAADYMTDTPQPHLHVPAPTQYWTTTSLPVMNFMPTAPFTSAYPAQEPPFMSYGAMQGMVAPSMVAASQPSYHTRAPTSSPGLANAASYQDPAVNRYLVDGMQNGSQFQFDV